MPGVFYITVKNDIVYKKLNKNNSTGKNIIKQLKDNVKIYKNQLNSHTLPIIGQFIPPPILVENNGNYNMHLINGINLMNILNKNNNLCKIAGWNSRELKLSKKMCINILKQLFFLEINLYKYNKKYSLRGDWFLHNLIFDISKNKIYNVDLEGFYTYFGNSPMCDLKIHIPIQFDTCKK